MLIVTGGRLFGQSVSIDTLRGSQPWGNQESYTFPSVNVIGQENVSSAINAALFKEFLDVDSVNMEGTSLSGLWGGPNSSGMPRISSFRWSHTLPRTQLLCLGFSGEYCGAYCEGFVSHSVFELNSGDRIEYPMIFTPEGQKMVREQLAQRWTKVVDEHIRMLEIERSKTAKNEAEIARIGSAIELFRNCLYERRESEPYIEDMEPLEKVMRFRFSRCSSHVDQELDDLSPLFIDLPYSMLIDLVEPRYIALFKD